MRVGHAGVALAVRRFFPRIPLWVLAATTYGPDIVEITLRVFGQYNRALSHSLVSVGIAATLSALAYALAKRSVADAAAVWLLYVSHWPADFITGTKATWPGGPEVGLNLYDLHPVLVWFVDFGVLIAGWLFYRTRPAGERSERFGG